MKLSIGGVLADAAALWRAERDVIVRIAGVLFLLPVLAMVMLAMTMIAGLPADAEQIDRAQFQENFWAFYTANVGWFLLISVALDYGALVFLNLFLHPGDTVGETLRRSLIRLVPYALLAMVTGAAVSFGLGLYIVPGVYIYGRVWMIGAAYAAEPERGLLASIERGFRMTQGNGWRVGLLGFGTAVVVGAGALSLMTVMQLVTALAGGAKWLETVLLVPVAAAGAAAYVMVSLVRVSIYRRLAGSISGT
jgi:hypothetical protein